MPLLLTSRELNSQSCPPPTASLASYYRARYYDPTTGRFISEDPGGLRGGINLYKYVADNPSNLVDPRGLQPSKVPQYYNCLNDCLHDALNCKPNLVGTKLGTPQNRAC